jgi:DNA polymerase-3 subunit delta'
MWSRLVGQDAVVRALREAVAAGAVGHAYLFVGPEGVGRRLAAFALAASLNCVHAGCGECEVCRRVLRGSHPDVHLIVPEGQQLVLAQIRGGPGERGVITDAFRSPVEGKRKVFVFEDAERMNAAAANALLKVLEEPPADVVFILMTDRPDDLPSTVVSRCRRLDFSPLPTSAVERVLTEHHGIDAERAAWAANVGGNLARALRLAHDPQAPERHAGHVAVPERLATGGLPEAVLVAEQVRAEAAAATQSLKERQRAEIADQAEAFGEGRGTAAARKRLETRHRREVRRAETEAYHAALDDIASWYRDRLIAPRGAGSAPAAAVRALDRIEATRAALERNAGPALALEALFAELGVLSR